jgi:hypothetical protein
VVPGRGEEGGLADRAGNSGLALLQHPHGSDGEDAAAAGPQNSTLLLLLLLPPLSPPVWPPL